MAHFPDWLRTVFHSGATPYVSNLYPKFDEAVTLRVRVASDAPVRKAWLRSCPDGEQRYDAMVMRTDGDTSWFEVERAIDEPVIHYRFLLEADDGVWWYAANGPQLQEPIDTFDFRILADYTAPSWLQSAVFYHIFPERFANGDPSTNVTEDEPTYEGFRPKTYPWHTPPDPDQPFPIIFYGGDLPGIEQNLDHLENLGVNAIYLNPIFTAKSNHKYDGADYDTVDPHFGGNGALTSLREAMRERNMRYMLDIVPNHCGYMHPWFTTAQADPTAPEADYFTFHNHPNNYESWLGVWTLPKLNFRNQTLREAMYAGAGSIMRKWLEPPFSADAWRVDVANMLGRQGRMQIGAEVTREMRNAVKETAPDAYLLGENFFDATAQLQGDQYDGMMNYMGFTHPLIHWLTGYKTRGAGMREHIRSTVPYATAAMVATMTERMAAIPWQKALQQFNLLGSHDTPRIRSLLGEDDALHKLAVTMLLTYPGVPCIYYGDEIGMVDDEHLDQRGCMVWDEAAWNQELLAFYKRLIALRRSSEVLQRGSFQFMSSAENHIAYTRGDQFLIIASRSNQTDVTIALNHSSLPDGIMTDVLTGNTVTVTNSSIHLPTLPKCALLLQTNQ